MESLNEFMVGVLYLVLIYEIILCVKQKMTTTDHKRLHKTAIESASTRTRKDQHGGKAFMGRYLPMPASGSGRPAKTSTSRRFIQMRILGRR